jgi:penicillin-binding protein 2
MFVSQFKGKKRIKVSHRNEIEPQDIFLDGLAQKKIEKDGLVEAKIEVPLSRRSFYGLFLFSFFVLMILFARTFQLQVIKGEEFLAKAERNKFAYSFIQSSRGVIYDRNMEQLVFNKPIFSLILYKDKVPDQELFVDQLSEISGISQEEILERIDESQGNEVVFLSDLDHEEIISLEIKTRELDWLGIEKKSVRHYQESEAFSHLIGYLGKVLPEEVSQLKGSYPLDNWIGRSGLERYYEETLRVIPGRIRTERDVFGNPLSQEIVSEPESGKSIVLSVDGELQKEIYSILEENLKTIGSRNAAIVALDPRTGEVLALISYPGFDSNVFSVGTSQEIQDIFNNPLKPLFNRAIAGAYPVGSSIKPFMAAAALEEKIVTPEKQFLSTGSLVVANPWNPSQPSVFGDWMVHGWVNLKRAIAVSSNVYFYIIGGGYENQKGLGADLIKKYLELFGWGTKTGIDLPDEKDGFIPSPQWKQEVKKDLWRVGDTYNLSIGQGDISVTPLQVTYAYTAIANKGTLMKPMVVREIVDQERRKIETKEPEKIKQDFISLKNIEEVRQGMREAVLYGSATILQSLPVSSAAKTGTAQIPKAGHYHNWVSVFAPYDEPEIVLTIVIEEVQGVRAAALPVARDILDWYFKDK